jgi:O-antigen/teichoic acid export membrane protein
MRIKHSILNIFIGIGSQVILAILGFLTRKVFLDSLGIEYLGVNGLFTNILSMLALTETGIGTAIVYALYKPIAENNDKKILALMNLFGKAYRIIAFIIAALGLSLIPFLKYFMKGSTVPEVNLYFLLFLANSVFSYLFYYKVSFLVANQKSYVVSIVTTCTSIVSSVIKLLVLYYTKSFITFLLINIIFTLVTNLLLSNMCDRMYPFLRRKSKNKIDLETKQSISKNIKALFLHKIGTYFVFGTDNIIISTFVSVTAVGLYSNYNLIIQTINTFINQVFNNITASMGNLIVIENVDKVHKVFKTTMFVNFWIFAFSSISFLCLIDPFIKIWIGPSYIMSYKLLIILIINFYVTGMRASVNLIKNAGGAYFQDRYAPIIESVINLCASLILVKLWGIIGVFIGTLLSTLFVPFWVAPYVVYKHILKKPLINYFLKYGEYTFITFFVAIITVGISNYLFPNYNLSTFIGRGIICFLLPNVLIVLFSYKREEFKYSIKVIMIFILKIPLIGNLTTRLRVSGK